jgi:hypothetical protein
MNLTSTLFSVMFYFVLVFFSDESSILFSVFSDESSTLGIVI